MTEDLYYNLVEILFNEHDSRYFLHMGEKLFNTLRTDGFLSVVNNTYLLFDHIIMIIDNINPWSVCIVQKGMPAESDFFTHEKIINLKETLK